MSGYCKTIVSGKLAKDPEMQYTANGEPVTRLTIPVDRRVGEGEYQTDWYSVSFWGDRAESVNQHLRKGSVVVIEGVLVPRPWETQDGEMRFNLEIKSPRIVYIDGFGNSGGQQSNSGSQSAGIEDDEDIPF